MDETTRSWSERERHTHTTNSETRIERKRERKSKKPEECARYFRVSQQTLDLIHCQSKLNRTSHVYAQGAIIHHSRVGERERESVEGGLGERIRVLGPVSEWERERASEQEKRRVKTGRKEERKSAGEPYFEEGRKTEKELRRETERGKLRSKRQRHRTQERGRDREYNVIRVQTEVLSGTQLPHASHNTSRFNTITHVHLPESQILFG